MKQCENCELKKYKMIKCAGFQLSVAFYELSYELLASIPFVGKRIRQRIRKSTPECTDFVKVTDKKC